MSETRDQPEAEIAAESGTAGTPDPSSTPQYEPAKPASPATAALALGLATAACGSGGLGRRSRSGARSDTGAWLMQNLSHSANRLGQSPLRSPSVFNSSARVTRLRIRTPQRRTSPRPNS